jgi:acetyl-CoA synthetase
MEAFWNPGDDVLKNSNIYQMMQQKSIDSYSEFWKWSVDEKEAFWGQTLKNLNIKFRKNYSALLDLSQGAERASWLAGAQLNIIESCFQNDDDAIAVVWQEEGGDLVEVSQLELEKFCNRIANGFSDSGLHPGDRIAIDMPMTFEAVAIYMAGIKAGLTVVTIADSFSPEEIATRLRITRPKMTFTQDVIERAGKTLPLYDKILKADAPPVIVISKQHTPDGLRPGDKLFRDFISDRDRFETVIQNPEDAITVLFSSGTTGEPKAIPWTHSTPVKCASDGYYHHNIKKGDIVCWPTNLGWMMGPWLIFASLINKGTMALYYGAPMGPDFGRFVERAKVTMLGVVPSIVRQWKASKSMEDFDWSSIKCFSSTGEASNPGEMKYLMELGKHKPVIEYCGGTEIGGGYVTSTVVQPNIPSTFSTQALGGEFVLLDEDHKATDQGEMFLIPPIMGLSSSLLNRDHHEVYFKGIPKYNGMVLRRHGDELVRLENGYYKAQGRADDAMNLGGIKVSSVQIEEVVNQLEFVRESAAVAVSPKEGGPGILVIFAVVLTSSLKDEVKLKMAKDIVREKLNPLFKVAQFIEIEKLPRTASGKVMRRRLRDRLQNP